MNFGSVLFAEVRDFLLSGAFDGFVGEADGLAEGRVVICGFKRIRVR